MQNARRRPHPGSGRGRRLASREYSCWPCRLLALLLLAGVVSGCASGPTGRLELEFRIAEVDLGGLVDLQLEPDWAGASRHPSRDAGWRRIALIQSRLVLSPGPAASELVAAGDLPAGRYDRVLVSTPIVQGRLPDGRPVSILSHIEPIARGFDLAAGSRVRIAIDLVLRPATANGTGYEIFVKQAEVLEVQASTPNVEGVR